jgi:hypothetical protein
MAWAELADGVAAGLRAAEFYEATGELWELTGVLAFVEYQHKTLARPAPVATHAAGLTGLAERVAPMAERLGHLGAQFLVVASRIRIEGIYPADLAFVERLADQLEAPGAVGGQSAAHLALHLAQAGRGDEAVEIVEAHRPGLPVAGRTSSIGAWNMLLGSVEALALARRSDEVAALRPLLDEALALDDWITFDGRLVSTRAAIAAAATRDWETAERHLSHGARHRRGARQPHRAGRPRALAGAHAARPGSAGRPGGGRRARGRRGRQVPGARPPAARRRRRRPAPPRRGALSTTVAPGWGRQPRCRGGTGRSVGGAGRDESGLVGVDHDLDAVAQVELLEDVRDARLCGRLADDEPLARSASPTRCM